MKSLRFFLLFFLFLPASSPAVETTPRVSDREIIQSLVFSIIFFYSGKQKSLAEILKLP